jgi:uncharacterized protein YdaT
MEGKKNTAPWTGDKAKAWVEACSKSEVKKLEGRKLIRQMRVSIQGSHVMLLSIDDPA